MPRYDFVCNDCKVIEERHKTIIDFNTPEKCKCGNIMVRLFPLSVSIINTETSFGSFMGRGNKVFDNGRVKPKTFKEYDRQGYGDALKDPNIDHTMKERIKEKQDKIARKEGKKITVGGK